MEYDSLQVAAYIARRCEVKGYTYSSTKIQGLLYCCYGYVLARFGECLCNEKPHAWSTGPAFPRVNAYVLEGKSLFFVPRMGMPSEVSSLIDEVIDKFGKFRTASLSAWLKQEGSPWERTILMEAGPYNCIPDSFSSDYFAMNEL